MIDKLKAPFKEKEIEWRVQSCGINKDGRSWVKVLAYVTARAIQNRLDEVFGIDGWKVEYRTGSNDNNIICRLSFWSDKRNEWIYKEDGCSETQVEPFKGGISGALKRTAASGLSIGRYLYYLDETFAECKLEIEKGWNKCKTKDNKIIYWKTPTLPNWALPKE